MNRRIFLQSGALLSSAGLGLLKAARAADLDLCSLDDDSSAATTTAKRPKLIRLRSAENPHGPPKSAIQAVQAELASANVYPRAKITEFRQHIAHDVGLTPEHVAIGAGSIELAVNTGLVFGRPGRAVMSFYPSWTTAVQYAELHGARWIKVPIESNHHCDFNRMEDRLTNKVDLVYLCNPDNPSGKAADNAALEAFVKEASKKRLVIIDEAFIDCLEDAEALSMKKLVGESENIAIIRTFSKLWGMAGFRVGYMLAAPSMISRLKATVPTLEMQSRLGVAGAIAAYDDHEFIAMSRAKMRESKKLVYEILTRHGLEYISSDANFISFQVPGDNQLTQAKLEAQGVSVKPVSLNDDRQWLRVSCGTPEELEVFDQALDKVIG